jgi:hypothetical protein
MRLSPVEELLELRIVPQIVEFRRVANDGRGISGYEGFLQPFQRFARFAEIVVYHSGIKKQVFIPVA